MKVKILLILTIIVVAVVVGIIVLSSKKEKERSPLGKQTATPTVQSNKPDEKLKIYQDPSGFLFKYPENIIVKQNKTTDQSIFSSLKLTSNTTAGNISLEITSSDLKNVDDWLKKSNVSSASAKISKITLADLNARQFEQEGKVITVAVDVGALLAFSVDYQKNKDFWLNVNKTVLSSFAFKLPEASSQSAPESTEGDIIFEGEEVIE